MFLSTYCIRYCGYNLMNKRNIVPALMGKQILVSANPDNTANWMCAMEEKYRLREKKITGLGDQQMPVCRDDLKGKKEPVIQKVVKVLQAKKNLSVLEVGKTLACAPQARWARRRVKRGDVETRAPQDLLGRGKAFGLYVKCSQKLLWDFHQKNDMVYSHF